MKMPRYRIRFPNTVPHQLDQHQAYFQLEDDQGSHLIRFHDYHELYQRPGLYEQLFYQRLKCNSPQKVSQLLKQSIEADGGIMSELRVLDVGAGNGMVAEALYQYGVARIVGLDILPEALVAAERDHPGIYDRYYLLDLCQMKPEDREELQDWSFSAMTLVAALGYGDIPPEAFVNAFNLVEDHGWLAFNIKESFFRSDDRTGFSMLIRDLMNRGILEMRHIERYRHRISMDGKPLYYYAIIGRKTAPIDTETVKNLY